MSFYPQQSYAPRGRGFGRGGNTHNYSYEPYGRGSGRGRGFDENIAPTPAVPPPRAKTPIERRRFEFDGVNFMLAKNGSKLKRITREFYSVRHRQY